MSTIGPGRTRGFLGRIVADPLRKLLALCLAALLWLYLNSQLVGHVTLSLELAPLAHGERKPLPDVQHLVVRLQGDEYLVLHHEDAATGSSIDGVSLTVSGPQSLVARLTEERELFVVPSQEELRASDGVFLFTLDRVQTADPALRSLLRKMTPRAVRVRLERLEIRRVRLTAAMVAITPRPDRQAALDRVDLAEARFSPEELRFRGSPARLDELAKLVTGGKLLDLDVESPPAQAATEWRTVARPIAERIAGLECLEPEVQVRFPVKPAFALFELEVPVLLDASGSGGDELRDLVVDPVTAKVALSVSGQLESELRQKGKDELRGWAKARMRLVATPPPGKPVTGPVTVLPILLLYDTTYKEGRDFSMRTPPPVVISPRK